MSEATFSDIDFKNKMALIWTTLKVDVSDRTNVYKAARESEILAGKVTILVNNAGIVGGKDFLDLDDKVIEKVLEGTDIKWMTHSC